MHHHSSGHDLLLYTAAGVIVAGPVLALAMDRWRAWIFLGARASVVPAERALRPALASLSSGAAAIHLAVVPEHYQAGPLAGLMLVAAACFQFVWAASVVRSSWPLLDRV